MSTEAECRNNALIFFFRLCISLHFSRTLSWWFYSSEASHWTDITKASNFTFWNRIWINWVKPKCGKTPPCRSSSPCQLRGVVSLRSLPTTDSTMTVSGNKTFLLLLFADLFHRKPNMCEDQMYQTQINNFAFSLFLLLTFSKFPAISSSLVWKREITCKT